MAWDLQSGGCRAGTDWIAELAERMYSPSLSVDNDSSDDFTIVKVIRVEAKNNQGVLLKVVQVLADLNLVITKAYITSDGEWSMDVFHIIASDGSKLHDKDTIHTLEQALALAMAARLPAAEKTTCIELIGSDRPGLLSEISAVLKDTGCNVVQAQVWTHRATAAAVVNVTDASSGTAIEDPGRILTIRKLLRGVLCLGGSGSAARTAVSVGSSHPQRRLHQMMATAVAPMAAGEVSGEVVLSDCSEKDYSVVTLRCPDRPKLLFDALCTIMDLDFVVFHAAILTLGENSFQEYFIRHRSGRRIDSGEERRQMERAIAAALERRGGGIEIELRAEDRAGLLSDVTRVLRENGLTVRRAEISTQRGEAEQRFLVWDVSGKEVDGEKVDEIREKVVREVGGAAAMKVKGGKVASRRTAAPPLMLAKLFKLCSMQRLRLIGLQFLGYLS